MEIEKMELQKGDIVQSFDFPDTNDCYYVGEIMSINKANGTFKARIIRRVWNGRSEPFDGLTFAAPLPNLSSVDGVGSHRVYLLEE
jgi:hypothetical protein